MFLCVFHIYINLSGENMDDTMKVKWKAFNKIMILNYKFKQKPTKTKKYHKI